MLKEMFQREFKWLEQWNSMFESGIIHIKNEILNRLLLGFILGVSFVDLVLEMDSEWVT